MTVPVYNTGTVSIAGGETDVSNAGTAIWSSGNVAEGDWIVIDDEVITMVLAVVDTEHITIPPWRGADKTSVPYTIYQNGYGRYSSTEIARAVTKLVAAQDTEGFIWFVPPARTEPDPSRGDEGQWAYQPSTGKQWHKEGGEWVYDGVFKGFGTPAPYDNGKTYSLNDVAESGGTSYVWSNSTPGSGHAPPNATYWTVLAGRGAVGPGATVAVGTVTTGAPGSDASVTNVGTDTEAILDFTIPRGTPGAGDLSSINNLSELESAEKARGNLGIIYEPQARITLTSGAPVMQTSVAGATRVYSSPVRGGQVPLYDGIRFTMVAFGEVYQDTTDTTKSPAAVVANANYDKFWWVDGSTKRCTRGPSWAAGATAGSNAVGSSVRGQGAGSTELIWIDGIPVNRYDIVNGPPAQRGTYAGTIRSNSSSTIDYVFGGNGAGGIAAVFNVWNAYNRVPVRALVTDSTANWQQTFVGWRSANSSANMRVSFVRGLVVEPIEASYSSIAAPSQGVNLFSGVGLNTTSGFTGTSGLHNSPASVSVFSSSRGDFEGLIGDGAHFLQAVESVSGVAGGFWYGNAGAPANLQTGLHAKLWA